MGGTKVLRARREGRVSGCSEVTDNSPRTRGVDYQATQSCGSFRCQSCNSSSCVNKKTSETGQAMNE